MAKKRKKYRDECDQDYDQLIQDQQNKLPKIPPEILNPFIVGTAIGVMNGLVKYLKEVSLKKKCRGLFYDEDFQRWVVNPLDIGMN